LVNAVLKFRNQFGIYFDINLFGAIADKMHVSQACKQGRTKTPRGSQMALIWLSCGSFSL